MQRVHVRLPARKQSYEIKIDGGLLAKLGSEARASLGLGTRRVALISNQTVFELYGRSTINGLRAAGFQVFSWLMSEGERHKSLRTLDRALAFLTDAGLERGDAVVALGGGVVGDLAGFAAAVYLRGISFIQAPTTLLAQVDASVGGKTAVNTPAGKNLVGAFHQPRLVLIDTDTLRTLPRRELTAGWCEAVKQGAVGSRNLFDKTVRLLESGQASQTEVAATIAAHCGFKASIVSGDEREAVDRDDNRSRRILNFGHTTAHALEKITGYRRFRHGEAVGYGVIVAGEISKNLGMLPAGELESLREAVTLCGPRPRANDLNIDEIIHSTKGDKKSVGGMTKWVLLERLGQARIIDGSEIDKRVLRHSLRAGLQPS